MLDIKKIREEKEKIIKLLNKRGKDFTKEIDDLLKIDEKRREILSKMEKLKCEQNVVSKKIPVLKKDGGDTEKLFLDLKALKAKISSYEDELNILEKNQKDLLLNIPNVPGEDIKEGLTDAENVEIRKFGTPKTFNFNPKPHWGIGANLDILDFERGSKITGSRFTVYKGLGAKLERALIHFFLDFHTKNGFKEILPPYIVNSNSMTGTGQLPKFKEDAFFIKDTNYYLIPTAEVPVTNLHANEILKEEDLPIKYCAYSACFRAEAGSAGRDTRGIIRQHQFNKVEMVKFTKPENSESSLESLTNEAEEILKALNLPYRVVCLCTGDLGFSANKTYDIEVWMPSYNRYVEISSCSNFKDYQSRRANIKYRDSSTGKAKFVHTLNGSGLAVGRCFAAILENYQNENGTVTVPEVLVNYMGTELLTGNN